MKRFLIVEDQDGMREMLKEFITGLQHECDEAADGYEALEKLSKNSYDLVISDLRMPGMDGMTLLSKIKEDNPDQLVIIITAHATIQTAVDAIKHGAYDYILKPFKLEAMEVKIEKALLQNQLSSANELLKDSTKGAFGQIVGSSSKMEDIFYMIKKISKSSCPVLILGESGTGKEMVARELHKSSERNLRPFVAINCAALTESVLESELFGHEKGAFTGAIKQKKGKFELANEGTLFLDEIGELSHTVQVKLLRFLQEKEFERVGGNQTIKVDVRIICATNRVITEEISTKKFREDLYYRINVIQLEMPPLRDRSEDILDLVKSFLETHSKTLHKQFSLAPDIIPYLMKHKWRGNVRELKNVIERAVVLCEDDLIRKENLPPDITGGTITQTLPYDDMKITLTERVELFEKVSIIKMLEETNGNQTKASKALGLKRSSLQYKLKKYGL